MSLNYRQDIYLSQVKNTTANLVANLQELATLGQLWTEEFGAGENQITDELLAGTGLNAYKLGLLAVLSNQLALFLNNEAPTQQANFGQYLRQLAGRI